MVPALRRRQQQHLAKGKPEGHTGQELGGHERLHAVVRRHGDVASGPPQPILDGLDQRPALCPHPSAGIEQRLAGVQGEGRDQAGEPRHRPDVGHERGSVAARQAALQVLQRDGSGLASVLRAHVQLPAVPGALERRKLESLQAPPIGEEELQGHEQLLPVVRAATHLLSSSQGACVPNFAVQNAGPMRVCGFSHGVPSLRDRRRHDVERGGQILQCETVSVERAARRDETTLEVSVLDAPRDGVAQQSAENSCVAACQRRSRDPPRLLNISFPQWLRDLSQRLRWQQGRD
mmetsp:Transcript_72566/g.216558  ORF Transcript_72566/g.216558 Transcript_72566/m.216558 type:complete len:291 (+) Transcript_72566:1112-1984(+)